MIRYNPFADNRESGRIFQILNSSFEERYVVPSMSEDVFIAYRAEFTPDPAGAVAVVDCKAFPDTRGSLTNSAPSTLVFVDGFVLFCRYSVGVLDMCAVVVVTPFNPSCSAVCGTQQGLPRYLSAGGNPFLLTVDTADQNASR